MDESESYRILKGCIDVDDVREARRALDEHLANHSPQPDTGAVMVHVFGSFADWPPECRALREKVEVSPDRVQVMAAGINVSRLQFPSALTFPGQGMTLVPPSRFSSPIDCPAVVTLHPIFTRCAWRNPLRLGTECRNTFRGHTKCRIGRC